MFLNYAEPIQWSPEFYSSLYQGNLYLLSEQKQFAIPAIQLTKIQQCIKAQTTVESIVDESTEQEKIGIYQTLDTLYFQGLLRNTLASNRCYLDIKINNPLKTTSLQGFSLYDLCDIHLYSDALDLIKSLSEQLNCNIIAIHDYLDPRLQDITFSDELHLIIKLTNKTHYIGPFFKGGSLCFGCMQYSVGRNQPLRMWLQDKLEKTVTVPYQIHLIDDEYKGHIFNQCKNLLVSREKNEIRELTENRVGYVRHRWQCFSHCKNCNIERKNQVTLKSCLKHNHQQGGFRHLSPGQTLQNIRPLVGSLAGIISTVSEVGEQINLPYKTYKSSFFRSIPSHAQPISYCNELTSLGKGGSTEQAEVSAICESFERYAAHYQKSDQSQYISFNKLIDKAIHPEILIGLTSKQKISFENIDYPAKRASHGANEFDREKELFWYSAWSLSCSQPVYVPLCYALAGTPEEIKYCSWNSNGCAAGNTQEEAILQGFLEVVERDAIAIWWYNKIQLPEVSLSLLPKEQSLKIQKTLALEWDYWVLDATHDFDIPVFAALAKHKITGTIMFGFGCHLAPEIAIERAITELCQLIAVSKQNKSPFDFEQINDEKYLYPNLSQALRTKNDFIQVNHCDIRDDICYCIEQAKLLNLDVLVIPYHRPELPVSTVKVVIPGTLHIWPQFALKRLYDTPVSLGWLKTPLKEDELNQHLLYV